MKDRSELSNLSLAEGLDWALNGTPSEQELAEADVLLAKMAEVAKANKRDSGESQVTLRMPSS